MTKYRVIQSTAFALVTRVQHEADEQAALIHRVPGGFYCTLCRLASCDHVRAVRAAIQRPNSGVDEIVEVD